MPYSATARARISSARPTVAIRAPGGARRGGFGELRRAFCHERVALTDERRTLFAHRDDDLAAVAEGIGHGADVGDRHRRRAVAVAHAEVDAAVGVADRAADDRAGQPVRGSALR